MSTFKTVPSKKLTIYLISKIDCTTNRETCAEFEVNGYPTILLIKEGAKIEKYSVSTF